MLVSVFGGRNPCSTPPRDQLVVAPPIYLLGVEAFIDGRGYMSGSLHLYPLSRL